MGKRAAARTTARPMPAPFAVFFAAFAISYRFGGFVELRDGLCGLVGVGWMPAGGATIDAAAMGGDGKTSGGRIEDHELLCVTGRLAGGS